MKQIKTHILGFLGLLYFGLLPTALAQTPNALETINVSRQGVKVNVKLVFKDEVLTPPMSFSVAKPARLAFDFANTANGTGKATQAYNESDIRSANIVEADGRLRLVFSLTQPMVHETSLEGKTVLLTLSPAGGREWQSGGVTPTVQHFSQAAPTESVNAIRDIVFRRGNTGEGRVLIDMKSSNPAIDVKREGQQLIIDFLKTSLPEVLRRRLDVTDFGTPILSVSTIPQGENVRMTISPRGLWEHNAYQADSQFVIEVRPIIEDPRKLVQGTRGGYQGEKLSLNFQNVEVRRLLQVIGEFTNMNIVVSDSVGGSITLILKDVPWDQALDIIMKQKGLDMRKNGNVILIAPREELATKEKLELEAVNQRDDLEPLITQSFQLNYVKGMELKPLLMDPRQSPLSKRGKVLIDDRSNIMFVQDTPKRVEEMRELIDRIDVPVRQVMIEARIVEAGDSFAKNLGIRLNHTGLKTIKDEQYPGGKYNEIPPIDKPLLTRPNDLWAAGGALSLPATPRSGLAAVYNLMRLNSAGTAAVSAEITALEADGKGKIISSPRVMTTNQVEALIEQGVEIPYQQATSSGATSISFRKANLSLKVKPQITPDGKITMLLDINKDSPNTKVATGSGIAIDTKHVKTEVLVENGGTVVIGGIYTETVSQSTQRIPFFGDLPYIGWLFKNREWIDDKTELLIFITPRIVAEGLTVR